MKRPSRIVSPLVLGAGSVALLLLAYTLLPQKRWDAPADGQNHGASTPALGEGTFAGQNTEEHEVVQKNSGHLTELASEATAGSDREINEIPGETRDDPFVGQDPASVPATIGTDPELSKKYAEKYAGLSRDQLKNVRSGLIQLLEVEGAAAIQLEIDSGRAETFHSFGGHSKHGPVPRSGERKVVYTPAETGGFDVVNAVLTPELHPLYFELQQELRWVDAATTSN